MQGLLRWTQLKQHLWPGTAHTSTKWEVHDEEIQNPHVKWAGERQEKDWNRQFLAADAKAKDDYDLIVVSQVDQQNALARFSHSMKMTLVKGDIVDRILTSGPRLRATIWP